MNKYENTAKIFLLETLVPHKHVKKINQSINKETNRTLAKSKPLAKDCFVANSLATTARLLRIIPSRKHIVTITGESALFAGFFNTQLIENTLM